MNAALRERVSIRLQPSPKQFLQGIIKAGEYFDLMVCNPPFHESEADANAGTLRKLSNLKGRKIVKPTLNFGGKGNELWCEGGEARFVADMIRESKQFGNACLWFTTLISKQSNLNLAVQAVKN